jgi:class 3 adenylate cyclase
VGDDPDGEAAGAGFADPVELEEGGAGDQPILTEADQQGGVAFEQHQSGRLGHLGELAGQVNQPVMVAVGASGQYQHPAGPQQLLAAGQDLLQSLQQGGGEPGAKPRRRCGVSPLVGEVAAGHRTPGAMAARQRALTEIDARPLLALMQAPTLILHRRNSAFVPYSHGQYLADHIVGAKLVELPGTEGTIVWETPQLALDHIEEFLTGARHGQDPARVLATVLFTDIVGSTQQARRLGDRRWRELLNVHDELARRLVEQAGGRLVKTTGDGILATFDGPGRGIYCAIALRDQLRGIEVQLRAGLHVGEVELRDGDVGGMAVYIAARVMAVAQPDEILVSRTVRDLVVGSDLVLEDRGTRP